MNKNSARSQLTAESLYSKGALKPGTTKAAAVDNLFLLSAPELYTLFLMRKGVRPHDYEAWLGEVLSNALLPEAL